MKFIIFLMLALGATNLFSQTNNAGLFKNINVKSGFTITYFHNFQGEYSYILQQNARVVEEIENTNGSSLSVVILFPLDSEEKINFTLNLALLDIKNNNANSETATFLDSQTPYGLGLTIFPFNNAKFIGFTSMLNIGRQNRLREYAIDNQFFPIADYPNYKLNVGAPVPDAVLTPFYYKETTLSIHIGIAIRL